MCARFHRFPTADDPAVLWASDPETLACWHELVPGTAVTVVKRRIDGSEATRYPAVVAVDDPPGPWRTLIATWVLPETTQGTLTFTPGDTLYERFSPEHPFDTFGVVAPNGTHKGWYTNVTWPAFLERTQDGLELTWQDLYLDLVITAAAVDLLDEDELDASALARDRPRITAGIRAVAAGIRTLAFKEMAPFITLAP
ncbi:MAG: DUF402 domain-containing protein [Thermomicrobiales bacterium]